MSAPYEGHSAGYGSPQSPDARLPFPADGGAPAYQPARQAYDAPYVPAAAPAAQGYQPAPAPVQQPAYSQAPAPAQAAAPVAPPRDSGPIMPSQTPPPSRAGEVPGINAPARSQRVGMSQEIQPGDLDVAEALRAMLRTGASDLHLTTGAPPMVRLDGQLAAIPGFDVLKPDGLQRSLYAMLTQKQREKFEEELELDFSHALVGEARFRVNIYRQRDSVGGAFRIIPYEIKPLEALGIPQAVASFAALPRGLVLVTGPTGSGKSTTLASLVDLANRSRSAHIMTVEDPIEFLHRHKRSLVNQREIGSDTHSFQSALRHVLRQDPDIILVGEMRDLETIQVALTAAETGHLVFATLHTQDAAQTIDRVIDVFPSAQQGQVRTQLATAVQGIVCQSLLRRADGPGRAVAAEVLIATPAIRNLIREGKTHQIYTALQAGASLGMQTMDQHLAELVKIGAVAYDQALEISHSAEEFRRLCGRAAG